jgi:hypothetical protein
VVFVTIEIREQRALFIEWEGTANNSFINAVPLVSKNTSPRVKAVMKLRLYSDGAESALTLRLSNKSTAESD